MTKTIAAIAAALAIGAGTAHSAPPPACSILRADTPRIRNGEVWATIDIYCRRGVQVLVLDAALQRSDHRRAIYGPPIQEFGRTRAGTVLHPHAYTPCGPRRKGFRWRTVATLVYGERTSRPARIAVRRSPWSRLLWCAGDTAVRR